MVRYPQEKKEQAVIDLCARNGSADEVAQRHGMSRVTLYQWRRKLLGKEQSIAMPKESTSSSAIANHGETDSAIRKLIEEKSILEQQIDDLKKSVYRLLKY